MMDIKNQADLQKTMQMKAERAIGKITDRVLKDFKTNYVLKYVYIDNPKKYERTMDFLNAWNWTPIKKEFDKISRTMWFNPGILKPDIDKYQHGSIYSTPPIVIASLMEILDKKGRSSSLWLSNGVDRKEAFWKKFTEDYFDGGKLAKIVNEEFSAEGFKRF